MDDLPQLRHNYKKFKTLAEEAGQFFRQKEHYSLLEQINFLLAFHKSYIAVEIFFEKDIELKEGKSVTISANGDFSKITLDYKHLVDEFETVVSIIYFNLATEDIDQMYGYCRVNSMPQEALVIKKLFDKFLV